MKINEVCKKTQITKKAIEYYIIQGLIAPKVLENGYREYEDKDIDILKKIAVFRKLGVGIADIKELLSIDYDEKIKRLSLKKELDIQFSMAQRDILEKLSKGGNIKDIEDDLLCLEQNKAVSDKIIEAFTG